MFSNQTFWLKILHLCRILLMQQLEVPFKISFFLPYLFNHTIFRPTLTQNRNFSSPPFAILRNFIIHLCCLLGSVAPRIECRVYTVQYCTEKVAGGGAGGGEGSPAASELSKLSQLFGHKQRKPL